MLQLFRNIAFFSLLFLGLTFSVQLVISQYIKNKTLSGHDNLVQTAQVNADLVFLGSSRCTAHFDPVFFDSAYHLKSVNIGVDGHSEIAMAITRLKTYLLKNKAPKYAIFTLDPLVGAGNEESNTNVVHKNDFARYAFFPGKAERPIVDYFQFNYFERYIPLYAILKYQLVGQCLSAGKIQFSVNGYDKHDSPADKEYSTVADDIKDKFNLPKEPEAVKQALDKLNKLCTENNIKLICVQTPVYSILYDEKQFSLPRQICAALGIGFIDVNGDTDIRNDKENFYNADHMNIHGVLEMNEYFRENVPAL